MRLKSKFVIHKVDQQWLMLFTSDDPQDFHGILRFNETGKFILDRLAEDNTVEAILADMVEEYDGDPEEMEKDIMEVIKLLHQAGALVD